jgi:hypothetical protein
LWRARTAHIITKARRYSSHSGARRHGCEGQGPRAVPARYSASWMAPRLIASAARRRRLWSGSSS